MIPSFHEIRALASVRRIARELGHSPQSALDATIQLVTECKWKLQPAILQVYLWMQDNPPELINGWPEPAALIEQCSVSFEHFAEPTFTISVRPLSRAAQSVNFAQVTSGHSFDQVVSGALDDFFDGIEYRPPSEKDHCANYPNSSDM